MPTTDQPQAVKFTSDVLKVYDPRTDTTIVFDNGSYETDDEAQIALLRQTEGVSEEKSKEQLVEEAKELGIESPSRKKKADLAQEVSEAQGEPAGA